MIHGGDKSDHAESLSLLYALYITSFAAIIGAGLFLMSTFFIKHDYYQVELYIAEHRNKSCRNVASTTGSSSDEEDSDNHPLVHSYYHEKPAVNT